MTYGEHLLPRTAYVITDDYGDQWKFWRCQNVCWGWKAPDSRMAALNIKHQCTVWGTPEGAQETLHAPGALPCT